MFIDFWHLIKVLMVLHEKKYSVTMASKIHYGEK